MTVTKESSLRLGHARAEGIVKNAQYSVHNCHRQQYDVLYRVSGRLANWYTRISEEQRSRNGEEKGGNSWNNNSSK